MCTIYHLPILSGLVQMHNMSTWTDRIGTRTSLAGRLGVTVLLILLYLNFYWECSAELGTFSSIVQYYNMMRTFSICVLFPLILIGWGIKEFVLFIYPYGWVLIFSDILLICFGERLKQFLTGIFWKNFRVQILRKI